METCAVTRLSLSEFGDIRSEVKQAMVNLPGHLRTCYFFELHLQVKLQSYFGITDVDKLKLLSESDPNEVGDEKNLLPLESLLIAY